MPDEYLSDGQFKKYASGEKQKVQTYQEARGFSAIATILTLFNTIPRVVRRAFSSARMSACAAAWSVAGR